jgi:DNA-binding NtrC family response regulator
MSSAVLLVRLEDDPYLATAKKRIVGERETSMAEQINALLVCSGDAMFQDMAQVLKSLNIRVIQAQNCREASLLFNRRAEVDLVFAGIALSDGSWTDVLMLARQSKPFLPVIVVSQVVDVGFYLDAIEKGAFDFVTPPFLAAGLAHIVRSAIYKELVSTKQGLSAPPAA